MPPSAALHWMLGVGCSMLDVIVIRHLPIVPLGQSKGEQI